MLHPDLDQLITIELRNIGTTLDAQQASDSLPPDTLHCPASAKQLNTMLTEGSLRALHCRMGWSGMLMDYGTILTTEMLGQRLYSNRRPQAEEFRQAAQDTFSPVGQPFDCYIMRLYEQPSASSYGSTLPGYSLGFPTTSLLTAVTAQPGKPELLLQSVIYSRDEQTRLLRECYNAYETYYLDLVEQHPKVSRELLHKHCWIALQHSISHLLPRFRSPMGSKQKEWIAVQRGQPEAGSINIDIIDNRYVPYILIDIASTHDGKRMLPLESIFIDASIPFEAGQAGLQEYLSQTGYNQVNLL